MASSGNSNSLNVDSTPSTPSEELYCPFFEQGPRPTSHTMRRGRYCCQETRPTMTLKRYKNGKNTGIPVTSVDVFTEDGYLAFDSLQGNSWAPCRTKMNLNDDTLFDELVESIEDAAIKKKKEYDPISGYVTTNYTVPVIGHVVGHPRVHSIVEPEKPLDYVLPEPEPEVNVDYNGYYVKDNTRHNRRKTPDMLLYNGKLYSFAPYYRKYGADLVRIKYPHGRGPMSHPIHQACHFARIDSTQERSDCIIYKFHREQKFCGLRLHPEKMSFVRIHSENSCKKSGCGDLRHRLSILKTDPGYVTQFELFCRVQHGDWLSLGKFAGSSNESEIVDVSFDEISASEFKFKPLDYQKSFSKISCDFFAIGGADDADAEDEVVYSITQPRDGKYFIDAQTKFKDTFKSDKKPHHRKTWGARVHSARDLRDEIRRDMHCFISDESSF